MKSIKEYKNWKLSGTLIQQYKQIGNAVPISLGKAIGKLIINHHLGNKIVQLKDFKYSRYLKTSDLDWDLENKIKQLKLNNENAQSLLCSN